MHCQWQILVDYTSILSHLVIAADLGPSIILSPHYYPWQKKLNPFSDEHQGLMYVVVFNDWWDLIWHMLTCPAVRLIFFLLSTCLSYHFTLHSHHPCYSPQQHVCRSCFKRCRRQPLLFRILLSRTIFACLVRIHHRMRECSPGWHWAKAPSDPVHPTLWAGIWADIRINEITNI